MNLSCLLLGHKWKLDEKNKKGHSRACFNGVIVSRFIGDWYICKRCLETKVINKKIIGEE
jgi:hypothetical protein